MSVMIKQISPSLSPGIISSPIDQRPQHRTRFTEPVRKEIREYHLKHWHLRQITKQNAISTVT